MLQISFSVDSDHALVSLLIQEAPQAQKMLKNQSSQNWMKLMPLRPNRSPNSGHIFTFSNGRCMRELSYSDRFLKQAKSQ
jgi:hypothetical protein